MAEDRNHIDRVDDLSKVALLVERLRRLDERLTKVEAKQQEAITLFNRYAGGLAFLIGAGVFIGWIFTIISGVGLFGR